MQGEPTDFWGKLDRDADDRVVAWHPLVDHSADVAACAAVLLESTLLRRRLAALGGLDDLSPFQVARLGVLAALHDLGKFNAGFQAKALPRPRFRAGHVREALALLGGDGYPETDQLLAALEPLDLLGWADDPETAGRLLVATICHHGRPYPVGGSLHTGCWQVQPGRDPFAGLRRLVELGLRWFPRATEPRGPLPDASAFQHGWSGLVMLADWLGSDTRFFPYREPGDTEDRFGESCERACVALARMGLDPRPARSLLGTLPVGFASISAYAPRPAQEVVCDLPLPEGPSLTILEAETGSGKTEAALARFVRLFQAGAVDGLYFALPTRTAATQLHRRVHEAVVRAFPDDGARPPVVLAVPGYLSVDDQQAQRLCGFEVLWNDDDRERYRYRGWAAENPKRYLAGTVVVGTIDQVLLSSLLVPHAHLRATALLRHLLVVDEVHASDVYMTRVLEQVLRFHLGAGGHVLLMSATLGAAAREAYLRLAGTAVDASTAEGAARVPYPAVFQVDGRRVARHAVDHVGGNKAVRVERLAAMDGPEQVASAALDAARRGARVLVVRNTVAGCLAAQIALEAEARRQNLETLLFRSAGVPAPHHARFARVDREGLDRDLEARFGREAPPGGCVLAATQTVEQSLDLDADLLLADLCPVDVLLQRIGRLHRHARPDRPRGFERARVVLLVPAERDLSTLIIEKGRFAGEAQGPHGLGTVYEDLLVLEATWRLAEGEAGGSSAVTWTIPAQNRSLVEAATHPEALSRLAEGLGPSWRRHLEARLGARSAERSLGALNVILRTEAFGDWSFPDRELSRRIQTRLGEDDRRALFDPPLAGPFGRPVLELRLPGYRVRKAGGDAVPTDVVVSDRGFFFSFGAHRLIYDRLGLREAPAEGERGADAAACREELDD